jgi:hypothetical protein
VKYHRCFALLVVGLACSAAIPAFAQSNEVVTDPERPESHPLAAATITPSGIMSVIAGTGYFGGGGVPGSALDANLTLPQSVAIDPKGDIYLSDPYGSIVYKITAGKIAVFAGTGQGGYSGDKGPATKAKLDGPYGLAIDTAGDVYIADQRNNRIRKVAAKTGIITTVAGTGAGAGPGAQDECPIPVDGILATKSTVCLPLELAIDSSGNLYIADYQNSEIRMISAKTGIISTVAGSYARVGYAGDGSLAVNASLKNPQGVAVDANDNIYIADTRNCAIRVVTAKTGVISSVLGNSSQGCTGNVSYSGVAAASASIGQPHAIAVDASADIFVTDGQYPFVYLINAATENFYVIAGINYPTSNLYFNLYPEVTLNPGPGAYLFFDQASGIAVDNSKTSPTYGDVIFSDGLDGLVYKIAQPAVPQANLPSISPAFPTQTTGPTTISITAPLAGSKIYYTTNGKLPTTSSTKYSKPFIVKESGVITAFATKTGQPNSQVSINVVLANPAPVFSATSVSSFGGTTPVTMTVTASGGTIYYTTDGSDPRAFGPTVQKYTKTITAKYLENLQAAYLPAPVTDFAGNVWQEWSPVTQAIYAIELP